ncbi:MAG: branched-chain amino acid transport system ATP-binding protein [Chloroflexota bacterium]|jgi:branched-chain amino acid transport system ATP-binding protein|nr:branched-chain amino acid transport system ATP-binding protein [Chloroflexota bacterium]
MLNTVEPVGTPEAVTAAAPILEVVEATKSFDGVYAVNGCSFSVRPGTITGLIGPNGAGKTTVFNLITGFLPLTSGQVLFEGTGITGLAPHSVVRRGIVRTFQIPREFKSMTVLENLMLVPHGQIGERPWGTWFFSKRVAQDEDRIYQKAVEVMRIVQLERLRDEFASNLSGGQKKLLELARTLMADPKMILLDEPGAGVNPTLAKQLMKNVESLRADRGITFLVIEHDMDLVTQHCDPVIVMSEGRRLMEGTVEEVKSDERVLEAYLGGQAVGRQTGTRN